jgi:electron transfer flavoprotein alpha subunit
MTNDMVGIVGAKGMMVIKHDAKVPVFGQANYGLAEDCRVFGPVLVKTLKNNEAYAGRATHVI